MAVGVVHETPATVGRRLGYVPALDGLRAVAVVAVMLYHGGLGWASWTGAGYLGVDMFFVLSGFLITTLLLQEWDRWGALDLVEFWTRRARRLLPALCIVLVAVSVYAITLATEEMRASLRGQGLATLFYVSNWWEIANDQSYFQQFGAPSPLEHTWSLGIEEQWYLVFPLALVGALTVWGGRGSRRRVTFLLGVGALVSASWMVLSHVDGRDPSAVYFSTFTRMQDLLVGAALAAGLSALGGTWPTPQFCRILRWSAVVGAVGVASFMVRLDDTTEWLYEGGFLAFSILTAAVIAGVVGHPDGGGPLARALGWEPLRLIGVVSYGLYLWHWPVDVVLTPARTGLDGMGLPAVRFLVTGVLATSSYVLVERSLRRGGLRRSLGNTGERVVLIATVVVTVGAIVVTTNAATATTLTDGAGAPQSPTVPVFGTHVFLVGDSIPYNLRENFDAAAAPGLQVDGSSSLGCGLIPTVGWIGGKEDPPREECLTWSDEWPGQVAAADPDLGVLFLGSWQQFDQVVEGVIVEFGTPAFADYLDSYLEDYLAIMAAGGRQVAVVNVPCHRVYDDGLSPYSPIVNDDERVDWLNDYLKGLQQRSATPFTLIDLDGFVCDRSDPEYRDGVKMRVEGLHFTREGASLVWAWLGSELKAAAQGAGFAPR